MSTISLDRWQRMGKIGANGERTYMRVAYGYSLFVHVHLTRTVWVVATPAGEISEEVSRGTVGDGVVEAKVAAWTAAEDYYRNVQNNA